MAKAFDKIAAGPSRRTGRQLQVYLCVPIGTVRDWEQHRRSPDAPARTLLAMIDADPKAALALIERAGR